MKKMLPLAVVMILVLTGLGASAAPFYKNDAIKWKQIETANAPNADVLDQSQPNMDWFGPIGRCPLVSGVPNYIIAQTFVPTKPVLTRVELMLGKNSTTTYPCKVAIRANNLSSADLASASIPASEVTTENFSWEVFDFVDIGVTPGNTYYIVSSTENSTDNWYAWGLKMDGNSYPAGTIYYSIDDEATWTEEPGGDMTFNTYGRENLPPATPVIEGQTNGKINVEYSYTFVATDPDGDDVYYWIDWGDECPYVEWVGPFASGEVVTVKHTYTAKGDYTIGAKAKDTVGDESAWGYLDVTMPRVRTYDMPLLKLFLERFPHAFPMLRHLIGL